MTTTTTEALAALVREMQEKPYSPEWNDRALSTLAQLEAERAAPAPAREALIQRLRNEARLFGGAGWERIVPLLEDAIDALSTPAQAVPDPCIVLWQAMREAEKVGQRTDDKLIVKFLREAGYVLAAAPQQPAVQGEPAGTPHCLQKLNNLHLNHVALKAECERLRQDAARFRYLLGEDSDWTICEWDHDAGYWVSDQREPDVVRAAIDAAMQAQGGEK